MRHYGFNFQWYFFYEGGKPFLPPDQRALDFMAHYGFNFARLPIDYRFWSPHREYMRMDEFFLEVLDQCVEACRTRGIHLALNMHRAPGYTVYGKDPEPLNLWQDAKAQEAFIFQWTSLARRYQHIDAAWLSFNLVNEPPDALQMGGSLRVHQQLMQRVINTIHMVDADRPVRLDGTAWGATPATELAVADKHVILSTRGYQPMSLTHYRAEWWWAGKHVRLPKYPGTRWIIRPWDRHTLHDHYAAWQRASQQGALVHVGECGCYNKTPNAVALRWYTDLFKVFQEAGWGFALWEFEGGFGIVNHNRPDAKFETIQGYAVDRALLDLMLEAKQANP